MAVNRNVHQWLKKSAENLRLAKLILNFEEKFYEHVCFNTQQSVEKAIKGYLTLHKIRFDKTHNIAALVALVALVDNNLAAKLKPAETLTKFAVRIRYPEEVGDTLVVDFKLAKHTIEIADQVFELLKYILAEDHE